MRTRLLTLVTTCLVLGLMPAFAAAQAPVDDVRYDNYRMVRAEVTTPDQFKQITNLGARCMACRAGVGSHDYLVPPGAMVKLERTAIPFVVHNENVQLTIDAEKARLQKQPQQGGIAGAGGLCDLSWFDDFKNLDAINARIDLLVAEHPDLIEKLSVGTTHEGRTIFGMKVAAPGSDDLPAVLISGCQHAREWVAPLVPMYLATTIACDFDSDAGLQALLGNVQLLIVPVVNPDGYVYSWGPDRFWRKNRKVNGDLTFGVDLNRNWDIDWNGGNSTSTSTNSDVYVGPSVMSEPEVQAMAAFMDARPEIVAHIDFHAYSQLVLQPWGWTNSAPPDAVAIEALGDAMSNAIASVHGSVYPNGQPGALLYLASGIFPDWSYDEYGIFGYTIELRPESAGGGGFELPPAQIMPTCEEAFESVRTMMEWAAVGVAFDYPDPLPDLVQADELTPITVSITPTSDGPLMFGTSRLITHTDGGPPLPTSLISFSGNEYTVSLPAIPCGSTIEYYFQTTTENGNTYRSPEGAPDIKFSVTATTTTMLVNEDFEAPTGWTVENSPGLTAGAWEQGVPVGAGDRGDPLVDGDGSGACYLTDNVAGNSDVDGGSTTLTSPQLDASEPESYVSYWRWLSNDQGGGGFVDPMTVEISGNDGQDWVLLETTVANDYAWTQQSFRVADYVTPGVDVRVRFTVADIADPSIVEGGVDGLQIVLNGCPDDGSAEDVNGDGTINVNDLIAIILAWGPCGAPCPEDVDGSMTVDVDDLIAVILAWG